LKIARLLQGIGHAGLIGVMPGSTQYLFLRRKNKRRETPRAWIR
jgi:hypothetical protein